MRFIILLWMLTDESEPRQLGAGKNLSLFCEPGRLGGLGVWALRLLSGTCIYVRSIPFYVINALTMWVLQQRYFPGVHESAGAECSCTQYCADFLALHLHVRA